MKKISLLFACLLSVLLVNAQDYTQVYLIGDATPNGWANDKAQKMEKVADTEATFSWTGQLKAGDFKLINELNAYQPAFTAVTVDEAIVIGQKHTLVYNDTDENDFKFIIATAGRYTVTADLTGLALTVTEAAPVAAPELWIMGDAVPGGASKLSIDPSGNASILRYTGALQGGTVKFRTTETVNGETQYYVPTEESIDIQDAEAINVTQDAEALGWDVAVTSPVYKITVNTDSKTIKAVRFTQNELYLIGGATVAGWTIENAIPFVQDANSPYIFTFEGELKVRSDNEEPNLFKILGQKDWGPYSLHPYTAEESIIGSKYVLENSGDDKWSIDENQQGNYKIIVNLLDETIQATYLGTTGNEQNAIRKINITSSNGGVQLESNENIAYAKLSDLTGNILDTQENDYRFTLGKNIPTGVYLLTIQVDKESFTKKVFVQ